MAKSGMNQVPPGGFGQQDVTNIVKLYITQYGDANGLIYRLTRRNCASKQAWQCQTTVDLATTQGDLSQLVTYQTHCPQPEDRCSVLVQCKKMHGLKPVVWKTCSVPDRFVSLWLWDTDLRGARQIGEFQSWCFRSLSGCPKPPNRIGPEIAENRRRRNDSKPNVVARKVQCRMGQR